MMQPCPSVDIGSGAIGILEICLHGNDITVGAWLFQIPIVQTVKHAHGWYFVWSDRLAFKWKWIASKSYPYLSTVTVASGVAALFGSKSRSKYT
jgi:hypothetical protein